jgi:hypothetical protein
VIGIAACSTSPPAGDVSAHGEEALVAHTFDYASKAPARLSVMFTMAWFGIDARDPQTPRGADPTYQNWGAASSCSLVTADPTASDTCIRMGAGNACVATGDAQRKISSRRRPLTGIWSGTGRDVESQHKLDLMLAMLRRPGCRADDGAKLDAWTMQNNSIKLSSKYVANPSAAADIPYRTMMALFDRADRAGIPNAVMPGFDSTWYFHFAAAAGLGKCDDSAGNPRASCMNAVRDDVRDLAVEAARRPSALKVNGKPVVFVYTDPWESESARHGGHQPDASEWTTILDGARGAAGFDFYVIGVGADPSFFAAFDALAPWLGLGAYVDQPGTSIYADSFAHTQQIHASLLGGVGAWPGRLVYGAITPGFDDWTRNWGGPCMERQMPTGAPRDPALMTAQSDFFFAHKSDFHGFIGETWDDWTEGSEFEPDVAEGPDRLVRLRQLLGRVFGDAPDAAGDARLAARWTSYGQARNGSGGAAGASPATDLACDGAPVADAGSPACSAPAILEPSEGQIVGPAIHLRASAPSCIHAIACYVDSGPTPVASSATNALDAWVSVDVGAHRVQCNGWDASGLPYASPFVAFTR